MNKSAQMEIEPVPLFMGIAGGVLAWIMASSMDSGIVIRIITTAVTIVACYLISWFISNK